MEAVRPESMQGLAEAAVGIGPHRLGHDEGGERHPSDMLNGPGWTRMIEGGPGAEPTRTGDADQDAPIQQRQCEVAGASAWRPALRAHCSNATEAEMSMNSSSHRICSGSSGWPKPASVAMRMKPSRPRAWTPGRRGPSGRWRRFAGLPAVPSIIVANESSPRTMSDAPRATAVPYSHRHGDSAASSAGASFTPSPFTAIDPAVSSAHANQAQLVLRSCAGDQANRTQPRCEVVVAHLVEVLAREGRARRQARRIRDRRAVVKVVPRHDHRLDASARSPP